MLRLIYYCIRFDSPNQQPSSKHTAGNTTCCLLTSFNIRSAGRESEQSSDGDAEAQHGNDADSQWKLFSRRQQFVPVMFLLYPLHCVLRYLNPNYIQKIYKIDSFLALNACQFIQSSILLASLVCSPSLSPRSLSKLLDVIHRKGLRAHTALGPTD